MSANVIAQLIIALGPVALELAPKLAAIWNKDLTPEEVTDLCAPAKKSYEDYISEAKARRAAAGQ